MLIFYIAAIITIVLPWIIIVILSDEVVRLNHELQNLKDKEK